MHEIFVGREREIGQLEQFLDAELSREQGRRDNAEGHFSEILRLGQQVAGTIDDAELREAYLAAPAFLEARSAARG